MRPCEVRRWRLSARCCCSLLIIGCLAPAGRRRRSELVDTPAPLSTLAQARVAEERARPDLHRDRGRSGTPRRSTQGVPALISAAFEQAGVTSEHTEDSAIFNDADLARFDALVMFQASGDPWTAAEKAAMERYQQAGGGIVAIHNATDMRGNYTWWDNLIGSLMPGHAATGTQPRPARPRSSSRTRCTPPRPTSSDRWARSDEWYNFSTNVRGDAHVLATMDETTYDAGRQRDGLRPPDLVVQALRRRPRLGHRHGPLRRPLHRARAPAAHRRRRQVGGRHRGRRLRRHDATTTSRRSPSTRTRARRSRSTSRPTAASSSPSSCAARSASTTPRRRTSRPRITIDVYSGGEDGLLGIAVDPNFTDERLHLRLLLARLGQQQRPGELQEPRLALHDRRELRHRPGVREADHRGAGAPRARRARPHRRRPRLRPRGQPAAQRRRRRQPALGALGRLRPAVRAHRHVPRRARDLGQHERPARQAAAHHAGRRRRLHDPRGQPVPRAADTDNKTLPEIYAMGFRNPFRFSVDPNTGWIGLADYAPDSGQERPADRGPAGIVEWNLIKTPGQLRLAAVHRQPGALPRRRLPERARHDRRRLLRLREPGQRLGPQHRPDQPPAQPRADDVLRLHEVVGPGGHPGRRRPRPDGRPVLRLRRRARRRTRSSRSTSTASRSSTSGRRTGSTR